MQLEKCRYLTDIQITFWDTAQYFNSKQLKYSFEKKISLKVGQIGCKRPNSYFLNKYCDLLVNASFTKFTGQDKLFLNNLLINLKKKNIAGFVNFVGIKPAERSVK